MDSIGVQGGSIPGLAPGGMVPTLILGDLSNNFAAEVFEARGLWGKNIVFPIDDVVAAFRVQARAPGGLVIENLLLENNSTPPAGESSFSVWVNVPESLDPFSTPGTVLPLMNIGGGEVKSEVQYKHIGTVSIPAYVPQIPDGFDFSNTTIWVPPGGSAIFGGRYYHPTGDPSTVYPSVYCTFTLREIPEVQGVAS